jgi:predicted double-glycine peptidase
MDRSLFTGFADELCGIRLEKDAGIGSWVKNQYNQLNLAAGQAMHGPASHSPITGQPAVPITGTVKNFLANKMPTAKKPPGPLISGAQKVLSSKPIQHIIPLLDQASEFAKLAQVQPYQQKTQYSCSAACLKAVLEHWGADRYAEHEIMHAIGVRDKGGAEVDQITEGAKKLGFEAYDKCFESMEAAKAITDQDTPIIADFQSFNNPGKGHYVVITKIDDDVVHLMDPNTDGNTRVITRAECEQRWWDRTMAAPHKLMPKWGVVVTPAGAEKTASAVPRWAALGAGVGGVAGAVGGYKRDLRTGKKPQPGKDRTWSSVRGGLAGAFTGGFAGAHIGELVNVAHGTGHTRYRNYAPPSSRSRPNMNTPLPFKGVKSKAEAKQRYRDLAMKHHPDVGGSKEKFQDLHNAWQNYQQHPRFPKNS